MNVKLLWLFVPLLVIAMVAFAACEDDDKDGATPADGDGDGDGAAAFGDVDILGIWGGTELESFEAMVAPWADDTGGEVDFVGTRDTTAQLVLNVEGNNPPDIAIPAEIGTLNQFARDGLLTPLSECPAPAGEQVSANAGGGGTLEDYVRANYPQSFIDLGTVDGTLYGFFMKADGKGFIWYSPSAFEAATAEPLADDASYDDLIALSDTILGAGTPPWTIGVESDAASGWPGTDWVQAILINNVEGGPEAAAGLLDGSVEWTDARVAEAFDMFGQIALADGYTSQGGGAGINATNFRDAIFPIVQAPPAAAMHHQATFVVGEIAADFPDAVPGEAFDFFGWPGGGKFGAANVVYAFNNDEETCDLMAYLATAQAQQIWVDRGGFVSLHSGVSLDSYPDEVTQRAVDGVLNAPVFSFDIDDTLGGAVQAAFWTAVTEYLAGGDAAALLAEVQAAVPAEEE